MTVFWIVILVATLLLEAATFALISIWFSLGSVAALIAAAAGAPLWLQLVLFTIVSGILLAFTRPLLKKLFPKRFVPTNSELSVGKSAIVIEEIDTAHGKGRVRLNGVDWTAVNDDNKVIELDTVVIVKEIRGSKLAVEVQDKTAVKAEE